MIPSLKGEGVFNKQDKVYLLGCKQLTHSGKKTMVYLNMKTQYGIETVDELDRKDFSSFREFAAEARRLVSEYQLAGMDVYRSQRCTKDWK